MSISLFQTVVTPKAIKYVNEVLTSTWLNEGKWVFEFEMALSQEFGFKHLTTTNNCTSALHLSLLAAGVYPGSKVIIPAQTFIATGQAVLMAGAHPVFADIDPNTGNIDPRDVRRKIDDTVRAIMPVHWGGFPCDLSLLSEMAGDIPIIEDAAHALGANVGTSDFNCFSFQAIKFLTSGDGGIVVCQEKDRLDEIKRQKWFGIDRNDMQRRPEGDRGFKVCELGFKYNMNNITAAIGLGNLDGIHDRLARRRKIAEIYLRELDDVAGIKLLRPNSVSDHSYWVFTMLVENRLSFIESLNERGIACSVLDRRIDEHPVFGGLTPGLKGQEYFDDHQISIPVHDGLSDDDVERIVDTIKKGW